MRRFAMVTALIAILLMTAAPVAADTEPPGDPPDPIVVLVTVDSGTVAGRTGVATVRGTLTCDQDALGLVSGEMRQRVGRLHTIRGWYFAEVQCSTTPVAWSATVTPDQGKFAGGSASVIGWAEAYTETGYGFDESVATLKLR
jgi:hypothetical protein